MQSKILLQHNNAITLPVPINIGLHHTMECVPFIFYFLASIQLFARFDSTPDKRQIEGVSFKAQTSHRDFYSYNEPKIYSPIQIKRLRG